MGLGKVFKKATKKVGKAFKKVAKPIGAIATGGLIGGPLGGAMSALRGKQGIAGGIQGGLQGSVLGGLGAAGMFALPALGAAGGAAGAGGAGGVLGGIGGVGKLLGGAAGLGLLGGGLAGGGGNIPRPNIPSTSALNRRLGTFQEQEALAGQQQFQNLQNLLSQERQQRMEGLSTGQEGEALRQQYNRLGLLDSGAFNSELARQMTQLAQQQQGELARQNLGEFDYLRGIRGAGLEREFGLQDIGTEADLQIALEKSRQRAQRQQGLIGAGTQLLGGLF